MLKVLNVVLKGAKCYAKRCLGISSSQASSERMNGCQTALDRKKIGTRFSCMLFCHIYLTAKRWQHYGSHESDGRFTVCGIFAAAIFLLVKLTLRRTMSAAYSLLQILVV